MELRTIFPIVLFIVTLSVNTLALADPYDYSFTNKCLDSPLDPLYGGGIAVNPSLNDGANGWTQVGNEPLEIGQSKNGNKYIVASRNGTQVSASQKLQLEQGKLYTFSAWVQASRGHIYLGAVFKTDTDNNTAGWASAKQGCWSMIKGGIVVNTTGTAELIFMTTNASTSDILVDNISLKSFTQEEWQSHQVQSVEKGRQRKVKFQVVNQNGQPITNATVSINQTRPSFAVGCAMNSYILRNPNYKSWFTSRFKYYTVFENELKWPFVSRRLGVTNYTIPDLMMNLTRSLNLSVRGHTVHWGKAVSWTVPAYLENVTDAELFRSYVYNRTNSVINKYKGQLIHWDVVNENLNNNWFDEFLGENASTTQFQMVHDIDPKPLLFLNDFDTIERHDKELPSAWKYLQKIALMRKQGYKGPLGIGLQGHFRVPNLAYLRASLDMLTSADLPIWITELDIHNETEYGETISIDDQGVYLDMITKELHAYPSVRGINIWAAMRDNGDCWRMCLTDPNFVNLPTGDVIDKYLADWSHASGLQGTTDASGFFETSLYYGEYEAHAQAQNQSLKSSIVKANDLAQFTLENDRSGKGLPLVVKISIS